MSARIMALEVLRTTREVLERDGDEWGLCGSMAAVIAALEADIAAPQEPAVNAELLEALQDMVALDDAWSMAPGAPSETMDDLISRDDAIKIQARAAIAKAGGAA